MAVERTVQMTFALTDGLTAGLDRYMAQFDALQGKVAALNTQLTTTGTGAAIAASVHEMDDAVAEFQRIQAANVAYQIRLAKDVTAATSIERRAQVEDARRTAAAELAIYERQAAEMIAHDRDIKATQRMMAIHPGTGAAAGVAETDAAAGLAAYRAREAEKLAAAQALFAGQQPLINQERELTSASSRRQEAQIALAAASRKQLEAMRAEVAINTTYRQALQQTSAVMSGNTAIRFAAARQALIEKRDMAEQELRWKAEAAAIAAVGNAHAEAAPKIHGNSLAMREVVTLGREMGRGDYSRMAGSASLLAQALGLLPAIFSPVGLAIAAVGTAIGATTIAFIKGTQEVTHMGNALLSTSNYAGLTVGTMRQLAETMSETSNLTVGASKDIVTQLVASGRISSEAINSVANLAAKYAEATGESASKVAATLIKMFNDPAKGAEELNKQMHFLNLTQLEHIEHLVRIGQEGQAQLELAELTRTHLKDISDGIMSQDGYLDKLRKSWSAMWDAAEGLGRAATPQEKLKEAQNMLLLSGTASAGTANYLTDDQKRALELQITTTQNQIRLEGELAKVKSAAAVESEKDNKRMAILDSREDRLDKLKTELELLETGKQTARVLETEAKIRKEITAATAEKHVHVTADVAVETTTEAQAQAEYNITKNSLRLKLEAIKQALKDEKITNVEAWQQTLIAQKAADDLEIQEVGRKRDAMLAISSARAGVRSKAGDKIGVANEIAAGEKEAILANAQIQILAANQLAAGGESGGDIAAKADAAKAAAAAQAALDAQVATLKDQLKNLTDQREKVKADGSLTSYQKSMAEYEIVQKQIAAYNSEISSLKTLKAGQTELSDATLKEIGDEQKARDKLIATQVAGYTQLQGLVTTGFDKFFNDMNKHGETLRSLFKSLFGDIESGVANIIKQNLSQSIASALGFGGSPGTSSSGGGLIGGLLNAAVGGGGGFAGLFGGGSGGSIAAGTGGSGWAPPTQGYSGPVPAFAVGTNYVPYDMVAQIHQGEAIVPAAYNNDATFGGKGETHVHNYFTLNEPTNQRTQSQIAAAAGSAVRTASARNR